MSYRDIQPPGRALPGLLQRTTRELTAARTRARRPGAHHAATQAGPVALTTVSTTSTAIWTPVASLDLDPGRWLIIGLMTLRSRRLVVFGGGLDYAQGRIMPMQDISPFWSYRLVHQSQEDSYSPIEIWLSETFSDPLTITMEGAGLISDPDPSHGQVEAIDARLTAIPL